MDTDATRFDILLAEDDPVSRTFLTEAARALGVTVTACADGNAALLHARRQHFDLLVLDHHLPGRDGTAILASSRADAGSASHATPAIATSADADSRARELLAAGFIEVLPKPLSLDAFQAALLRHGCPQPSTLDDAGGLRACGSAATLATLRKLFVQQDLPQLGRDLDRLAGDPAALQAALHRLHAACGFCGATALAAAGERLRTAVRHGDHAASADALAAFRSVLTRTRSELARAIADT